MNNMDGYDSEGQWSITLEDFMPKPTVTFFIEDVDSHLAVLLFPYIESDYFVAELVDAE